jgi:hypothetical protein
MPRRKSISDEEILDRALPLMTSAGPSGFTLADLADFVTRSLQDWFRLCGAA